MPRQARTDQTSLGIESKRVAEAGRLGRESTMSALHSLLCFCAKMFVLKTFGTVLTVSPCGATTHVSGLQHKHARSGPIFGGVLFVLSESH